VLDELSIGLHPRDTVKLLSILNRLKDKGNSIFVVEHDPEIIRAAEDGRQGGEVIFQGIPEDLINCSISRTATYLKKVI